MKVNGKEYPIYYGLWKIKNVPNHQPGLGVVDKDLTFNKRMDLG